MASPAPPTLWRRRLRLAVAGAVALTALSTVTAGAAPPSPMGVQAVGLSRLGAGEPGNGLDAGLRGRPGDSTGPRSQFPGFLLERGRYRTIEAPSPGVELYPVGINNRDRGQVIGLYLDDLTGRPGTIHGYLWDRGRLVTIDTPDAPVTLPLDINDRGQIVGNYENPNATPSRQRTGAPPPRGMEGTTS
jgi:hypothetical protein